MQTRVPTASTLLAKGENEPLSTDCDYRDAQLLTTGHSDGNIRYYEYENDKFEYLSEYKSADPQRGIAFLPRRGINVSKFERATCEQSQLIPCQVHENEVMRAFKTVNDTYIEPISFTVPRRAETFQADIFPPAVGLRPAVSAKEWLDGKTGLPAKIDLESIYEGSAPKEVSADYQPPAPVAAPVAPKVEPKKEEPKEEPKPVVRAPPPSVSDQKSSISAMANKYQDADEEEPKAEEPSSFDEEVKPVHRNPLPVRSEPKPATPPAATPAPAPIAAPSVAASTAAAASASHEGATSLDEIKELIENQTKVISAQNDQIGLLTSEVESLKKRLGSGSQDQSERIRQLELELEEARS